MRKIDNQTYIYKGATVTKTSDCYLCYLVLENNEEIVKLLINASSQRRFKEIFDEAMKQYNK